MKWKSNPNGKTQSLRPVTPISILAAKLNDLVHKLQAGDSLNAKDGKALEYARDLAKGLDPYLELQTTAPSNDLANLLERTRTEDWQERFAEGKSELALEAEMLSGAVEGQLLRILVRAIGARHVLEIGMFTGYSALAMAEVLPKGARLIALEVDAFAADFARRSFPDHLADTIDIRVGPAAETLGKLATEDNLPFDFVFIDANKDGYWEYLDTLLDCGMVRTSGLIAIDNTLLQGEPYVPATASHNGKAIAHFNRKLAEDVRVEQVLLPLRDGLTLAQVL